MMLTIGSPKPTYGRRQGPHPPLNAVAALVMAKNGGSLRLGASFVDTSGVAGVVVGATPISHDTLQLTIVTATDRGYFFDTLSKARGLGIGVAAGCAVLCAAVSVAVSAVVYRGLSRLQAAMVPAARLECDPTAYAEEGRSVILDIARLQEAFGAMNEKLRMAGEYFPQSVKAAWAVTTDTDSDSVYDEAGGLGVADEEISDQSSATLSANEQSPHQVAGLRSPAAPTTLSDASIVAPPVDPKLSALKPQRTVRIAVLSLNLLGFRRLLRSGSGEQVASWSADLTEIVLGAVRQHKGVVDTFQGDRYTVTFNAVVPCAAAACRAASAALAVSAAVSAHAVLRGCAVSSGVAFGAASVGDIGAAAMRRFGVLGDVVAQAHVLERLCRWYAAYDLPVEAGVGDHGAVPLLPVLSHGSEHDVSPETPPALPHIASPRAGSVVSDRTLEPSPQRTAACVVAESAAQDLRVHFDVLGVDCVRLPGTARPAVVSAVVAQRDAGEKEDEWLYVVGDSAGEPLSTLALAHLSKGDRTAAEAFLRTRRDTSQRGVLGGVSPSHQALVDAVLGVARENVAAVLRSADGTHRSLGPFYDNAMAPHVTSI